MSKADGKGIRFLGHSENDGGAGTPELLRDHLNRVTELAMRFAAAFGAEQQARAAGLLHDLGKYGDQFQRRLVDSRERGRDHWTMGALFLATKYSNLGILPACAAAGHHTGLKQLPYKVKEYQRGLTQAVSGSPDDYTETDGKLLWERFQADGFSVPKITAGLIPRSQFAADMLDMRMFFSSLVDADYLATEGHFNGDAQTPFRPRTEGPALDLDKAIETLDRFIMGIRRTQGGAPMSVSREALYAECLAAAGGSQGLFTLSAPTGSGKTLAMLAFALYHARQHSLRRIVLVMPFLNIIDQTARIYRDVFSCENGFDENTVLENHSLAGNRKPAVEDGADKAYSGARLLAENWDAPIVLTTTVQFFESLMADRPSQCRKLHRLARSVVLFDEAQSLPPKLAVATLATLSRLTEAESPYRSTVVFATATQPAFDVLDDRIRKGPLGAGWKPKEIVRDTEQLFANAAGRVRVDWQHRLPIELDELAVEVAGHDRVLCIVNLKRHAIHLANALRDRLGDGLLHLSTNMCPAHRAKVLKTLYKRLRNGAPICLIATQCVEAGVDLDFPTVYRALAPLEAIAQAAGRCNRHGSGELGQVIVFKPRDDKSLYPPGYKSGVEATETFLNSLSTVVNLNDIEIINSPERLRQYYRYLYTVTGRAAAEMPDERELHDAIRGADFPKVTQNYKLIENDAINVLVPYDRRAFDTLRDEISSAIRPKPAFCRAWMRRAAPCCVSIFRPSGDDPIVPYLSPLAMGARKIELSQAEWAIALPGLKYNRLFGLVTPSDNVLIG